MSTTTIKVPFGQKIAFGIGMLANQMFPAALGIFMVVFSTRPWLSGMDVGYDIFITKTF